jgi:hypothetical protein
MDCAFGRGLNVAQQIATKASIRKLKANENFQECALWGQILGQENDYIIVYATNYGATIEKSYYFSIDQGLSFSKLPAVDAFIAKQAPLVRGLFTGNPSRRCYAYSALVAAAPVPKPKNPLEMKEKALDEEAENVMNTPPAAPESTARVLVELERLAWTVSEIEKDTCLAPTGYYYFSAQSVIRKNGDFAGIPLSASVTTSNFQLFREPLVAKTLANRRANVNTNTLDFLDPVDRTETWQVSASDGGMSVRLRSLLWPGFEFNVTKGANCRFQRLYVGYGDKNSDLPFMC